jgi:hypothetical protein
MKTPRQRLFLLGLSAALALSACHDDGPAAPPHYTEPAALVGGYATTFTARNAVACVDLLQTASGGNTGFRFFPTSEDLPALDWLAGESWGYEREGGMLSNMLDPTYVSAAAAAAGFTGVGALNLKVDSITALAGNEYDVVVSGAFALKRAPLTDVFRDVSLRLVLATKADGTLVIREMHELSLAMGRSSTGPSWATVRSWYRDPATGSSDPNEVVAAHAAALTNRDLAAYTSLLDENFRYFPQSQDLQDLPWMTGNSWDRAEELGMIGHMFDPDFQPAGWYYAGSVDTIHATLEVDTVQPDPPGGGYVVTTHGVIRVLYDAYNGAQADVRLQFHLVSDDGHLLISEIHELPSYAPASPGMRVEPSTWGSIKAAYR